MRKPVLVIAAILLTTGASFAQPAPAPSAPSAAPGAQPSAFGPPSQLEPPPPSPPTPEAVQGRRLSETTALGLSLGGTIAGWSLLFLGMSADNGTVAGLGLLGTWLGPNAGHWYAGAAVTRGTGLRLVGAAGAFYGFIRVAFCETTCKDRDGYLMIGGALLYVAATVDDILTAPQRARRRNEELDRGLRLAPMVAPRTAGIALGGRF